MKTKKEKFPRRYVPLYLIDLSTHDYEELNLINMKKRLDKSETFIQMRCNDEEIFVINDRAYRLTNDFGRVWDLI